MSQEGTLSPPTSNRAIKERRERGRKRRFNNAELIRYVYYEKDVSATPTRCGERRTGTGKESIGRSLPLGPTPVKRMDGSDAGMAYHRRKR